MEGHWTDKAVNATMASDPGIRNMPGDGKFDQSGFPRIVKVDGRPS
jgi:hypothetical protein